MKAKKFSDIILKIFSVIREKRKRLEMLLLMHDAFDEWKMLYEVK